MRNEKMLDKIRKLLELANSDNEHEANLASEQAHKLMLKHHVSQSDLTEDDYESRVVFTVGRVDPRWKFVANILNKHFNVIAYTQPVYGGRSGCVFGTKENVAIAEYMYHFLMRAFRECWLSYKREQKCASRLKQAFWSGMCNGLSQQLTDSKHDFEQQTGLVVVDDAALDQFRRENRMRTKKSRICRDAQTSAAGNQVGSNLRLRKGVGGESSASGRYLK